MTNESKHTKGPWTVDARAMNSCGVTGQTAFVANCSPRAGGPMKVDECQANARLIAAAPEMLEALRQITEAFERYLSGSESRLYEVTQARAAIAKAEGRDE